MRIYRYIYALLCLAMIVVFWPAVRATKQAFNESETRRLARYPTKSLEEVQAEFAALETILREKKGNPEEYFQHLERAVTLQESCRKSAMGAVNFRQYDAYNGRIQLFVQNLHQKYRTTHGLQAMSDVASRYNASRPISEPPLDFSGAKTLWILAYQYSLVIAALFFFVRLLQQEHSIILELAALWPLPLAILFWPIAFFVYPTRDPARQMARALRFATASIATALSCFGGVAVAADKKPDNNGKRKKTAAQTINESLNHLAVDVLPLTNRGTESSEYAPEYGWLFNTERFGTFSGFGFFEGRKGKSWFTNHVINWAPVKQAPWFAASTEQGANPRGGFFQAGAKIGVNKVPGIGKTTSKVFTNLVVAQFSRAGGEAKKNVPNETVLIWSTKDLRLPGGVRIRSEGFDRIRNNRPNFGQWQVHATHRRLPKCLSFLAEFEHFGMQVTPLFGVRVTAR